MVRAVAGSTDLYRAQHRELLVVAADLSRLLDVEHLNHGGGEARRLLRHLAGKLTIHLGMEDRSLYPELLRSRDERLQRAARRFQADLGGLRLRAQDFFQRWLGTDAISSDPRGFAAAARPFLHELQARITTEDEELYPLADEAGG
jgi:hypothetical protein